MSDMTIDRPATSTPQKVAQAWLDSFNQALNTGDADAASRLFAPVTFALDEPPTESGGVIEAWLTFETKIGLGARLRQLGVPSIVIDRHDRPGDRWRKRYKSLCLHDPVWYDHLPYIDFPANWPVFAPKDKIGDWLTMYTRVMEINYWTRTTTKSATYDETGVKMADGEELPADSTAATCTSRAITRSTSPSS